MPRFAQMAHKAMDQRIADAIERRLTADSIVLVDGTAVTHEPFGGHPWPGHAISSDGLTFEIAGRRWEIDTIVSYDPDLGDFEIATSEGAQTVSVRTPAIAA